MNEWPTVCVCVRACAEGQAAIKYILPPLSIILLPWLNLFTYITNFILEVDIFICVLVQRLLLCCFYFCDFLFILSKLSPRRNHSPCTTDSLSVLAPSPPPHPHPHPKAHDKTALSNAPGHFSPVFKILGYVRYTYLNTLQVPVHFKMTTQINHYVKWCLCTMCCIKCSCQSRLCKPDYVLHYLACATYDCLVVLTLVILTYVNFSPVRGLFAVLGSVLSTVLTTFYLSHDFYGLRLNYIYRRAVHTSQRTRSESNFLCSLFWKGGIARVFWPSTIKFFFLTSVLYSCTVCKGFIWNQQNQSSCHCGHLNRNVTVDSLAKINATTVDGRRSRNSRAVTSHCSTATEQHWPSGSDLGRLHSAFRGFLQPVQANGTVITLSRLGSCP